MAAHHSKISLRERREQSSEEHRVAESEEKNHPKHHTQNKKNKRKEKKREKSKQKKHKRKEDQKKEKKKTQQKKKQRKKTKKKTKNTRTKKGGNKHKKKERGVGGVGEGGGGVGRNDTARERVTLEKRNEIHCKGGKILSREKIKPEGQMLGLRGRKVYDSIWIPRLGRELRIDLPYLHVAVEWKDEGKWTHPFSLTGGKTLNCSHFTESEKEGERLGQKRGIFGGKVIEKKGETEGADPPLGNKSRYWGKSALNVPGRSGGGRPAQGYRKFRVTNVNRTLHSGHSNRYGDLTTEPQKKKRKGGVWKPVATDKGQKTCGGKLFAAPIILWRRGGA